MKPNALKILLLSLSSLCIILVVFLLSYLFKPLHFPGGAQTYIFAPGTNSRQLANDLKQRQIISHPLLFRIALRFQNVGNRLKGGEYRFTPDMNIQKIISMLRSGDVVRYEITLVDGWTFKQAFSVLESNPYLQHTLKGLTPAEVSAKLHLSHTNPEGLFLPETYQFTWPDTDQSILERAAKAEQVVLKAEWPTRTTGLIYKTPYQALIAASLIQQESGHKAERTIISGVIYRRLVKGMRLQIDPTVIYALGERYNGKLTRRDLRVKSAYNTYLHYGLPPTPIALVSSDALYAALHPNDGDQLYFVAKGDGSHHFSSSLKAHDRAIIKYLLKSNHKQRNRIEPKKG